MWNNMGEEWDPVEHELFPCLLTDEYKIADQEYAQMSGQEFSQHLNTRTLTTSGNDIEAKDKVNMPDESLRDVEVNMILETDENTKGYDTRDRHIDLDGNYKDIEKAYATNNQLNTNRGAYDCNRQYGSNESPEVKLEISILDIRFDEENSKNSKKSDKKKSSSVKSDAGDNGKDSKTNNSKGKKTIGLGEKHNESAGNLYEGADELSNNSGHNSDHKVFALNNCTDEQVIRNLKNNNIEGMDNRGPLSDIGDNSTTYTNKTEARTNQMSNDPNVKLT